MQDASEASWYVTPPRATPTISDSLLMGQVRSPSSYKSELQIILHRNHLPIPVYTLLKNSGPSHQPTFTVRLDIISKDHTVVWYDTAKSSTRKGAECEVAKKGLEFINKTIQKDGDLYLLNVSLI